MPVSIPLKPRDFLIFLALADGERHGYGLVKEIESLSDGRVRMDPANLYRALRRLVRDGLVVDAGRRIQGADGERRFYSLTDAGRQLAASEARRLEKLTLVARARQLISDPEVA